ncbi:NAD-dependent epimerase/dehydratase family protein [Pedobacter boryungensis]|uniref:Epimerase n=1 Tax=Pedobacter boryungensis TaxID=869962 RepID=A0ABX2DBF3_9SPHI|nr:NAD-dependent epimerase/dehydratase family protein [Pedobacter boryungensis]NQX31347.1 epimerase [Pedobacter boryungensis]
MDAKVKAIITGTTGMVGEGVLYECLQNPNVEAILVINRKSCGYHHPKLKEIIHQDFFDFSSIENELKGYNACFFCLGVSSVGMDKDQYFKLTHTLTLHVAQTLSKLNPDMTFCYVSGAGTNSSEKGSINWAIVKGKTENDLMKLPFKQVFNFRPGIIKPIKGLKNTHNFYKFFMWLFPVLKAINQNSFVSLQEISLAMINATKSDKERRILEVRDIIELAKQ